MAKKGRGGNAHIEWFGFQELLDKIEKANGSVNNAIEKAIKKSAEPVKKDLLAFMVKHSPPNGSPWATGDTLASWREKLTKSDNTITLKIGFSIKDGGLPAVFLNYGGFYTKPYLFIEQAIDNNIDTIKQIQEEALKEILKELQ